MKSFKKNRKDSVVAYALSREYEDEGFLFSLSSLVPKSVEEACQEWIAHDLTIEVIKNF